ncbi:hypothetical protein [Pseudoalteromonas sp. R3]|uniref:hypothetical protein n=1 Tax=Pseudoalteromonas sp. R3 TaxID=1709477 RepID=UPI0006B54C2B|nr:hypothetical protein [Pseudoalteromonas sp. R3]AZZ98277.1 hypothetical protein ELR70_14815 [Pseudoalteromonas sp. R3]
MARGAEITINPERPKYSEGVYPELSKRDKAKGAARRKIDILAEEKEFAALCSQDSGLGYLFEDDDYG